MCHAMHCDLRLPPGSWLAAHACPKRSLALGFAQGTRPSAPLILPLCAAVVPSPGQAVYAAAKAGLRAYFQSMASELSERQAYGHLLSAQSSGTSTSQPMGHPAPRLLISVCACALGRLAAVTAGLQAHPLWGRCGTNCCATRRAMQGCGRHHLLPRPAGHGRRWQASPGVRPKGPHPAGSHR